MKRRTTRRRVIMIFADIDALFDAFTRGGFQSFSPMKPGLCFLRLFIHSSRKPQNLLK